MQFRYINHVLNLSYLAPCVLSLLDFSARPKQDRQQKNELTVGTSGSGHHHFG